ncbi:MAG: tetratricopeptide repeat protein [Paludibacteraceae bacterium]|nr:tetratricopeptide repeat protein [Paludibacteraceae bacterium]
MSRTVTYLTALLLAFSLCAFGQSAKQADELFNAREYEQARAIYDALVRRQPNHPLYLYRAARCAQETGDLKAAEELFIKAGTKYPLRNFFLGELYYSQWRMEEALAAYDAVLPLLEEGNERRETVLQRMASAQVIARYLKHVSRVEVIGVRRMPKAALSGAYRIGDENGTLRIDSLGSSFTTQRADRRYFSVSDSTRVILVGQQRLLQDWEAPDTLPAVINGGTTNAYPFVLTDGATMYFSSDREGGLGGLDIYMTRYNAALGEWLPAENIGMPYNSPYDDYLYAADEHAGTAYFTTNRHCADTDSVEVYQIALGDRTYLRGLAQDELVALARLDSLLLPATTAEGEPTAAGLINTQSPTAAGLSTRSQQQPSGLSSRSQQQPSGSTTAIADSIYFVLDDEHVYTSIDDFQNDSARVLYEQYMHLRHTQTQAEEMLDSLRHQYYDADAATRASLKARIPILSGEINSRKQTLRQTITQVRALELQ